MNPKFLAKYFYAISAAALAIIIEHAFYSTLWDANSWLALLLPFSIPTCAAAGVLLERIGHPRAKFPVYLVLTVFMLVGLLALTIFMFAAHREIGIGFAVGVFAFLYLIGDALTKPAD